MPQYKFDLATRRAMGARLAQARLARGYTQSEVAVRLGITKSAVAHLEGGRRQPAVPTLTLAADMLGVSTDWLLCRTSVP